MDYNDVDYDAMNNAELIAHTRIAPQPRIALELTLADRLAEAVDELDRLSDMLLLAATR